MNISSIIRERPAEQKLKPIREGWGPGGTAPFFLIQPLTPDDNEAIEEASVDPDRPQLTVKVDGYRTRKVRNIREDRRAVETIRRALAGWEEFTAGDLASIMPLSLEVNLGGADPKTPLEFSEENRSFVAEHAALKFGLWVIELIGDLERCHAAQKESDLGNSASTSDGGSAAA